MTDSISGVVDVTRVHIQKPTHDFRDFWSGKDQFHALKYEVVVSLPPSERIVWVNGPFLGSNADISVFRYELLPALLDGEFLLADLGYLGEPDHLWTPHKEYANQPLTPDQREENLLLNRVRSSIERVNKRLKQFGVLGGTWRHEHSLNGDCFDVVARITNIIFIDQPLSS